MLTVSNLPIFVFYAAIIATVTISIVNGYKTLENEKRIDMTQMQSVIGLYLMFFIIFTGAHVSGKSGKSLLLPYLTGFFLYYFGNIYSLFQLGTLSDIGSEIVHLLGVLVILFAYRVDKNSINLTTFLPAGVISTTTNKVQNYGDSLFVGTFGAAKKAELAVKSRVSKVKSRAKGYLSRAKAKRKSYKLVNPIQRVPRGVPPPPPPRRI